MGLDPEAAHRAVGVEAHRGAGVVAPAVDVGRERLRAPCLPRDGPAEPHRTPRDDRLGLVVLALEAEAAADVGGDDPDLVLGEAERAGDHAAVVVGHLRRERHREAAPAGPVLGEDAPGFERVRGEALVHERQLDDVVGVVEGRGGLGLVADRPHQRDVVLDVGVEPWRPGTGGADGIGHGLEPVVTDLDQLGRLVGGVGVLGDDDREGLAGVADRPLGEDRPPGLEHADLEVEARPLRRHDLRRDGPGHAPEVVGGEDAEDAVEGRRGRGVDRVDPGVAVPASPDRRVGRPRADEVGRVGRLAREQGGVLASMDAGADRSTSPGSGHGQPSSSRTRMRTE